MGKQRNKQRRIPTPGPSTTPVDLFLIAGLPNPQHAWVEKLVQQLAGPAAKVIANPSPGRDGALYRNNTVQVLLTAGAQFAIRRLRNRSDDQTKRPRRIVLLYVPAEDQETLIDAFDFFVFPVPLDGLQQYNSGRQLRHDRESCEKAIRSAMEIYKDVLIETLQRKIESRKSHEPLLLPPANFHLPNDRLRQVYQQLTRGTRPWGSDLSAAETFDHDRLPDFLRPQERQPMFRDARGVVFPCSRSTEMHGAHEIDPTATVDRLREMLQSSYRFGAPLPQGFHHDAQFERGRQFDQLPFDCCRKGRFPVSGSHANVYPNDFVNPAS